MVVKEISDAEDTTALRLGESSATFTHPTGTSGAMVEQGDVSYGQTEYLSQKAVMSFNPVSDSSVKFNNGEPAVKLQNYSLQQQQHQQQQQQQHQQPPQQHYYYGGTVGGVGGNGDSGMDSHHHHHHHHNQQQQQQENLQQSQPTPIQIEPLAQGSLQSDHPHMMLVDSGRGNNNTTEHAQVHGFGSQSTHQGQEGQHQQVERREYSVPSSMMGPQHQQDFGGHKTGSRSYMYDNGEGRSPADFEFKKETPIGGGTTLKIPRYSLSYASTISVPAPIDMKSNYPVLPPFMHEKEPDIGVNRKSVGGDGGPRTPGYGVPTPEGRNGGENADAEKQFDPYDPRSERNTYDSRPGSAPYNSRPGSHGSHTSLYSGDVYSKSRAGDDMTRRDSVSMETTPTVTPTTSSGQPQGVTNVDAELAPSVVPEVMSEKNGSSPMRLGDDQPATHSDSGIVHDGGSNTSSNSSGDQDDSAAMLKSHSTGSNGDNSFRYDMPPTSLADPHRRIGESGALSSPFLTPSASTSHNITPNSDVTSKEEDRLPGDVTNSNSSNKHAGGGFISSGPAQFPSPLSAPSGDESSGTPERRPLSVPHVPHPLTPSISSMGSAFLSPGSGMGLSPSPRNPLTPSSTRSMSPDPLPPNMFDGNKDVYFCHLCSYVGTSQFHFKQHMDTHFEHRCPHCDYTSRTEGRLKRHIKDFHSDVPPENYSGNRTPRNTTPKPKVYKCKQCEFQTMNKVEFWEHSRTHIKEDKVLQCPKCPFVTEYKHHLEYHLRNHFGSKPFKCPKCNYACVNKSMLNSHMKSHTNVYQYRCADCTYATKYCHSLKLHLKKYNHKPATVLNADGSLPIDGSGDFELVSKRGPPRGPRGPRKGERQEQPMNPINHMGLMPQMTGMNGMPPPGMMPGYWPMMPPMPNGGLHPPPPLIPVSGSPFNPNLPMPISLQAPLQQEHHMMMQRHHHLQQQQHLQHHGEKGGEKEPHLPGDRPSNTVPGSHTRIKCVICDYTTDNRPSLNEHMLKVHAKENQDLLNMFGVQHDTFSEDPSLAAAAAVAAAAALSRPHSRTDSTSKPEVSETAATPIKQEICSQSQSPPPANQAWIMNASQPGARRSTPGDMFPSPMFRSTPQGAVPPSPQSMDILQQQLLKERYNAAIAAEIATNIEAEAKQNGECPLDLTKRKEQMQHLAASHMFFNQGFMFSQMQKRKFDEVSMVAMAAVNAASQHGPYPPGLRSSPPVQDNNNSATPRKRSRKGKAYKLDTICQKLQERYGDSPPPDGHGSNDEDTSDSINSGMHDQLAARGGDGELENEQIDYSAIHSSLSELNNQMAVDAFRGDPHTGEDKGLHEAGNDNHTEEVSSGTSGITFSGSINRRKLFMVRHNTDNKNEQQGSVDGGEDSEMNGQGASRSQPVPHGEEEDDDEPVRMTVAQSTPLTTNAAPTEAASSTSLPYECSHCAIAFRDCVMYTVHMGYHGYQDPFKCNMCGLVSQNSVEFFLHIARVAHE